MNTLYIKNDIIKSRNQIVLEVEDEQIINPTHEMLLSDGWELYTPTQEVVEKTLEEARQNLQYEILNYDSSEYVNMFYIGELPVWLDKAKRVGLLLRFQAEKSIGGENTTLWYNNTQFPLNLDMAIEMLYAIELYASACYDNTQRHLSNVKQLSTFEEIENYDYKSGYPDNLFFQF